MRCNGNYQLVFCRSQTASKFSSDVCGASAVEFALVSVPFISLLGAIIQIGLMVWANQNLDETLRGSVRLLYVGSFQSSGTQSDAPSMLASLKSAMCGSGTIKKSTVFSCQDVKLDVSVATSFGTGSIPDPIDPETKNWNTKFGTQYTCAAPGTIVIVTAAVKFPAFFNIMPTQFGDGSNLLQSTAVFRTEPYPTDPKSKC